MTAKFDSFVSALRDLCREHGVALADYGGIAVFDKVPGIDPLQVSSIEDRTRAAGPEREVHHINGDPNDNRPENLQIVKVKANRKAKEPKP